MNARADLLSISYGRIRFRSKLNGRFFSLVMEDDGCYQLVELDSNDAQANIAQVLYAGTDGFEVMNVIWKEVNYVRIFQ